MSHQTKRPFDSVECSTPHDLLIRCSLSNLQFPAIALTWCGLTSHRHRSIEPFFMSLAARDSEFRRWSGRVDRRICQTFAASPAEPGELPLGFSGGIASAQIAVPPGQDNPVATPPSVATPNKPHPETNGQNFRDDRLQSDRDSKMVPTPVPPPASAPNAKR